MAEKGQFRIGFRGFHKDDVLQYIDEMTTAHTAQVSDLQARLAAAEEQLEAVRLEAETAKKEAEESEARAVKNAELSSQYSNEVVSLNLQVGKLTSLAKAYKQEILRLREQADLAQANAASENSEREAAAQQIEELQEQNALLSEQNEKYLAIIGDMNRLVTEARVMSESYFENAHHRSVEIIEQLDRFLDDLKSQAKQNRFLADVQRKKGEGHIHSLLTSLKSRDADTQDEG